MQRFEQKITPSERKEVQMSYNNVRGPNQSVETGYDWLQVF